MSQQSPTPPKWADRFLGWYCSARVREQVQGDAHELFYWRLAEEGHSKARKAFMWDVFRLFKWSNIRREHRQKQQLNSIAMFKNYFKIGLRNLWKQKMPSTINIIGLSLAVGCCLVAFKWIESKFVTDGFHDNASDTYLVTPTRVIDGNRLRYAQMSITESDMLKEQVPGIRLKTRYISSYGQIEAKDMKFGSNFFYADSEFLEVFSFPMLYGDKSALKDPRSVVLHKNRAEAFFGDKDPLGEQISIVIQGEERFFTVKGVLDDYPDNSTVRPEILVNFSVLEAFADKNAQRSYMFIVLDESVTKKSMVGRFDKLITQKNELTPNDQYEDVILEPLTSMAQHADDLVAGFGGTPPMAPIIVLSCIGAFMLLLSTFNYVNIATVMAMKRMKEIGVRKVIGSRRIQLIVQFLTENLILCTLAIAVGCLLASAMFIPWFNDISGSTLTLDLLNHQNLWWFLLILLAFITLASGAYPAFYISAFKPVSIFRGNSEQGSKRRLTGVLLTFQMVLAVITIVAGIMFVKTNQANKERDWGYDQYNKLVFSIPAGQTYQTLAGELEKKPNVQSVAASRGTMGQFGHYREISVGEKVTVANIFQSTYNYAQMIKVKLKEGAFFNDEVKSENMKSLLVNETLMSQLQLDFKKDLLVTMDSTQFRVAGVIEDFHHDNFSMVIRPMAFQVIADEDLRMITAEIREGTADTMKEEVATMMSELDPEHKRFNIGLQESVFDGHYEEMKGITNIMLFTATLAILLSAMGLFGLVSLSISSRQKDFSIKKVLGANLRQLSGDIYKRFMIILGVAIVLGGAVSVLLIGVLLDSAYGYHESIGIIPIGLAGLILMGIAALTINTQVINVKRMNPAETLRSE